jgi:glycosyltransferase involved in cell wall biosynthesis
MTDLAVIMSVYINDRAEYVIQSVQSILNQTFTDFTYFLIFDGPVKPDIDSFIASVKDKRLKLFRLPVNGGLAGALNYLLEIIMKDPQYKIIARMDADDISNPNRFEKQRDFLLKNQGVSCVGCWYQEIDESGKHLSDRKFPTDHESLKKHYFSRTPFAHPTVMFRRQLIEKAGYYPVDTFLMEDNVLWGRALKAELRFANIPEYLLKFRIDDGFYSRRSGIRYGWNFIKEKIAINKELNAPFLVYPVVAGRGILKMLPVFLLRQLYALHRKF